MASFQKNFKPKEYERTFLDYDPYYNEKTFFPSRNQAPKRMSTLLPFKEGKGDDILGPNAPALTVSPETLLLFKKLDITRITNRIIVCATPWEGPTDPLYHHNNLNELASFLNTRYQDNYLIWNLSG